MMAFADKKQMVCITDSPSLFPISLSDTFLHKVAKDLETFSCFGACPTVAVACSGGADSMALLLALHHLTQSKDNVLSGGRVVALTVNHGLRNTAEQDCDFVVGVAHSLGIESHVLYWQNKAENKGQKDHQSVTTAIQERARNARYGLLSGWCQKNGVLHLCTGHHRDDQIETVIMRQNAGSGVYGLAGIAPVTCHHWGRILRPMLNLQKQDCEDFLRAQGMDWVHDPSNDNTIFERVRLRQTITPEMHSEFLNIAKQSKQYRMHMDNRMGALLPQCDILASGCVAVPVDVLQALSADACREWCVRLVSAVGGLNYRIGAKDISPLMNALNTYFSNADCSVEDFKGVSVGGCDITLCHGQFWIVRSWGVVQPMTLTSCTPHANHTYTQQWDNKFDVFVKPASHKSADDSIELGVLGKKGWQTLAPLLDPDMRQQIRTRLPLAAIYGLPTVRQNSTIMAVQGLYNADLLKINWHMTRKITPDPFSFGI